METRYISWERSAHHPQADCLDCHSEPGIIGEVVAHIEGLRYLWVLATGREQIVLRAHVPEGTCVECHEIGDLPEHVNRVRIGHRAHSELGVDCEECHRGFHDRLVEGGTMQAGFDRCLECHTSSVLAERVSSDAR